MEKTAVYCSWADSQVLSNRDLCDQLPQEILEVIRASNSAHYLDTLASAILIPRLTDQLFVLYEPLVVDLAARWCQKPSAEDTRTSLNVLSCFARILPAKPCLKILLQEFISNSQSGFIGRLAQSSRLQLLTLDVDLLSSFLLALFRLYSHDLATYSSLVSPVQLSSLLRHDAPPIRYLTIRCLALYMKLADALIEKMISNHLSDDADTIPVDGAQVIARLFSLWEESRWKNLDEILAKAELERNESSATETRSLTTNMLSPQTAVLADVLLPRSKGISVPSSLVTTPTTQRNFEKLAKALLTSSGILCTGPSGSGKTLLVTEAAKLLNKLPSMITLHLNEQTDAKSLLGIYTTSPIDGCFTWQPGILTRAMMEGRWVVVEDIHRAPPEVTGVILPIIEHGEISIPSRNQRIRAATGFCIIATTTEIIFKKGSMASRLQSRLSPRLWNTIEIEPLQLLELEALLCTLFPILQPRVCSFLSVHAQVQRLFEQGAFRMSRLRPPDLRDLLKWCRRSQSRLTAAGLQTGAEPVDASVLNDVFSDGVACYAGHISSQELHVALTTRIATVLQIPPQQMRHCIYDQSPSLKEEDRKICVGRATCPIIGGQVNGMMENKGSKSSFALTRGTLKTMEEIATAIQYAEPALLVGETGIGKTAVIQYLATLFGQKLNVINLSQQSESGDLLGGFKPVTTRSIAIPMSETFDLLFDNTFSLRKNVQFQASTRRCILKSNWTRLVSHWEEAVKMADAALQPPASLFDGQPNKRRKLESPKYEALRRRWQHFSLQLSNLKAQVSRGDKRFAMAFVEGKIVQALRNGEWVLLDEINLATSETLESIAELLHNPNDRIPSLLLPESGTAEPIQAERNFRIFAAMNPATDTGKRELPGGLRTRFTELFVSPSDTNLQDLIVLVSSYIGALLGSDKTAAADLAKCYLDVQRMNKEKCLIDGAGHPPHFSVRSLVRALIYTNENASVYGLRRALYEGFLMSFATMLSTSSEELVTQLVKRHLLGGMKTARSLLNQNPKTPVSTDLHVVFRHHVVKRGNLTPESQPHYIITPFVERNLLNLARAVSVRHFPILLQGPTSSGKTSMVEYLAKISGNEFVRINNHEHTDLQEYLGLYASGEDGRLQYREGVLVQALRRGHWVVLDELNLAPTDVLEALNRLLDDNRELFIPETQETIRPHPNFVLFATQNPAGLYGGRKHLSRAFRNRFLELHFDDIPEDELEFILKERTQIAPSFCSRIVAVYKRLSMLRQSSRLFEQRNSFATLRDLFRWASRQADDREQLAVNGFMLLAERVRDPNERMAVKQIIEEVMKVTIDEAKIYSSRCPSTLSDTTGGVIWTPAMRRLFVLVTAALENNEPVLLVGETGSGKTQICQTVAGIFDQHLHILNAHSNTETGDLIGAQRPVRQRAETERRLKETLQSFLASKINGFPSLTTLDELIDHFERIDMAGNNDPLAEEIKASIAQTRSLFEWADGSLVVAMKRGELFLLDEISLAEDSVLERLNSVLETGRSILLAEKGPDGSFVQASPGFQFLATMNPGGDYGKKELSLALRNRLTEIWVPPLSDQMDVLPIINSKLGSSLCGISHVMIEFAQWFCGTFHALGEVSVSLRELLTWVEFVRSCEHQDPSSSILHGAALVYLDSLGANPAGLISIQAIHVEQAQRACLEKLGALLQQDVSEVYFEAPTVNIGTESVQCGAFKVLRGNLPESVPSLVFDAPTTKKNVSRIFRALQLSRPILIEGDPGVGKTALVEAIAQLAQRRLTRINLSDQTDLMDLFGSDVPVEGGSAGSFSWRDGPFLRAVQNGEWVLLDEMNLASQSVLEGLNSCLDHRKQVYIAELDQNFVRHPDFVLFATQNPHHQGGGRKGLPASFVNRFTVVYADALTEADFMLISQGRKKEVQHSVLTEMVSAVSQSRDKIRSNRSFDSVGGPWEVNLRDIDRWLNLYAKSGGRIRPASFFDTVITQRFRAPLHRRAIRDLFDEQVTKKPNVRMFSNLSASVYQIGNAFLSRDENYQPHGDQGHDILPSLLPLVETLIHCVNQSWPAILVGKSGSGKSTLVRHLAALHGAKLLEFSVTEDTDTMDLIGGYDQLHQDHAVSSLVSSIRRHGLKSLPDYLRQQDPGQDLDNLLELHRLCSQNKPDMKAVQAALEPLSTTAFAETDYSHALEQFASRKAEGDEARFAWIDGVLVEAVQMGYWLVLDNANTCNPAVLDRLNSLLESGGKLIISEQHGPDGRPRLVQCHQDFRIFLTMDPQRGELSRAMRNRSVEVFLDSVDSAVSMFKPIVYPNEAATFHWRRLQVLSLPLCKNPLRGALAAVFVGHLSFRDLRAVSPKQYELLSIQGDDQTVHELAYYASLPSSLLNRIQDFQTELTQFPPISAATVDDQSLHPESNEPLIQMNEICGLVCKAARLGWLLESFLTLCRIRKYLSGKEIRIVSLPFAGLTVLEASIAARRIPGLAADDTQPVIGLIQALISAANEGLTSSIISSVGHESWPESEVNAVLNFLKDLLNLSGSARMQPGVLPIYLEIGETLLSQTYGAYPATAKLLERSLEAFGTQVRLSYGQSLRRLWSSWRPRCAANSRQLDNIWKLEDIMQGFDDSRRNPLLVQQIAESQLKLLATRDAIFNDFNNVAALLEELQGLILEMSSSTNPGNHCTYNYFVDDFEALCQYHDLEPRVNRDLRYKLGEHSTPTYAALLAGRNTKELDLCNESSQGPAELSRIASYAGWNNKIAKVAAWKGTSGQDLLGRLKYCHKQPLESLESLTEELSWLAKLVAETTVQLNNRNLQLLGQQLISSICGLVLCHTDLLKDELQSLISGHNGIPSAFATALLDLGDQDIFHQHLPSNHHLRRVWKTYLSPALSLATSRVGCSDHRNIGASLVYFALASLQLWIPDKPTDPGLYLSVQRDRYQRQKDELGTKLEALKIFESTFSGVSTSMRIRGVEREIELMGLLPPPAPVARLRCGNLLDIQAEFSTVLSSIVAKRPEKILLSCIEGSFEDETIQSAERSQEIDFLRRNIDRMVGRLSRSPRDYEDLTIPAVQLLQILDLGAAMLDWSERESLPLELSQSIAHITRSTPFLGASPTSLYETTAGDTHDARVFDSDMIYLETASFIATQSPCILSGSATQSRILLSFESCYLEWKTHLQSDRSKETEKGKLYEYKGLDEEFDAEEFEEVFPTFDDKHKSEEIKNVAKKYDPRAVALKIANLHAKLLAPKQGTTELKQHVLQRLDSIASLLSRNHVDDSLISPSNMLPALFLLLEQQMQFFQERDCPSEHSIYADPNIKEARTLLKLVQGTIGQIELIKEAWPEHSLPVDILACCNEVTRLQISDPIAKLLTKTEKLHAALNEWETVASRQYSVAPMIDSLTNLIVSWRRLELSSWSRLLDVEDSKCDEDARSWWFVVYEVAISIPLRLLDNEGDCFDHAKDLVRTLISFLRATSLGQFQSRLQVLENFRQTTESLVQSGTPLGPISSALSNLIAHFKRYELSVLKAIADGRGKLDEQMREQIKLASWKDTNVTTLRESARRSHYKLFKIVKKYRALLAKPIETFSPEDGNHDRTELSQIIPSAASPGEHTLLEALAVVEQHVDDWDDAPRRFREPAGAAGSMIQVHESSRCDFDTASELNDYTTNLISTTNELISQTPSKFNVENRAFVLHLKARKRRLLADVLRDVRHMGIRHNLNTQEIEKQSSLGSILGSTPDLDEGSTPVEGHNIRKRLYVAKHNFHGFLDLVDEARKYIEGHSADLTASEVGRCMGSLEGFLLVMQKQRSSLGVSLEHLAALRRISKISSNLQLLGTSGIVAQTASSKLIQEQVGFLVSWLPQILGVACEVLEIQAKHAGKSFTKVMKGLNLYRANFEASRLTVGSLLEQELPAFIQDQQLAATFGSLQNLMTTLRKDLDTWIVEESGLAYLLTQLLPWTDYNTIFVEHRGPEVRKSVHFDVFKQRFTAAIDKIFVSMQTNCDLNKKLPETVEDARWFIHSDQGLALAIRSFHMKEIATELEVILSAIAGFDGTNFQKATSLSIVLAPIVQQYYFICEHAVAEYADLHAETCRLAYILLKSFNNIASKGFCGPANGSTNAEEAADQLEQGTGLAEGEGAEDISKDVGDDEDLSELAQQQRDDGKEETEKEENAVDMGTDDIQGDMDEHGTAGNDDSDDDQDSGLDDQDDDMDDETGSVDNLDPAAVDEKLWEGLANDNNKELENEKGAGKSTKDKTAAQEQNNKQADDAEELIDEDHEQGAEDDEENVGQPQTEKADPHLQQDQVLELAEEMQLDGDQEAKEDSTSDDGLDGLSDVEEGGKQDPSVVEDVEDETAQPDDVSVGQNSDVDETKEDRAPDGQAIEDEIMEDQSSPEDDTPAEEDSYQTRQNENDTVAEDFGGAQIGVAGETAEDEMEEKPGPSGVAPKADLPSTSKEQQDTSGGDPQGGTREEVTNQNGKSTDPIERRQAEVFKKLGDILERWHRQQREIWQPSEGNKPNQDDINMTDTDFEHVENQDDQGDDQALGGATKDQARALDEYQALEDPISQPDREAVPPDAHEAEDVPQTGLEQAQQEIWEEAPDARQLESSTFIANARTSRIDENSSGANSAEDEMNDVDHQLKTVDLSTTELQPFTSPEEALRLWSHYSSITHPLSLILTEQLRLILSPTQATKLRGDFRTGKRLNIKRIIPYIASGYRRDKIWMRRSIPSKRNYQIMLAVDDSKSMTEGGAHALAFETLALLCKSLSMLEVGEVCVVGFGDEEHIRIAHGFGVPFTNDSGAKIYQNFSFQQSATNVRKLVQESIQLFREARAKGSSSNADLWQLQLIISDGIYEDHELVRRLVRQAAEERIMIVFVIVDSNSARGNSILDLTQAVFEPDEQLAEGSGAGAGEMKLKMKRYLDGFPFPYYVVVREMGDLPGVLATALKGWFREVVDVR